MGSGNSKGESPPSPKDVQQPVNIMITKEVTERWETLRLRERERKIGNVSGVEKVDDSNKKMEAKMEVNQAAEVNFSGNGSTSCENNQSPSTSDIPSSSSINKPVPMQENPTDSVLDESGQLVQDYDKMDKFANFFVPRNSWKRLDLENGSDREHDKNFETRYSAFERQPTDDGDHHTIYEEVDETVEGKGEQNGFVDEEAIIGNDVRSGIGIKSKSRNKTNLTEVRVPKPALPVIVDEDEDGKVTIETINAWKMRQRLEQKVSQNDSHWAKELHRITAKVEDETRRQADDFQKRMDTLKKRYGDDLTEPVRAGAHCNLLVSQIGNCYQKNESQVLKCSELVHQFAQCTNKTV